MNAPPAHPVFTLKRLLLLPVAVGVVLVCFPQFNPRHHIAPQVNSTLVVDAYVVCVALVGLVLLVTRANFWLVVAEAAAALVMAFVVAWYYGAGWRDGDGGQYVVPAVLGAMIGWIATAAAARGLGWWCSQRNGSSR